MRCWSERGRLERKVHAETMATNGGGVQTLTKHTKQKGN